MRDEDLRARVTELADLISACRDLFVDLMFFLLDS